MVKVKSGSSDQPRANLIEQAKKAHPTLSIFTDEAEVARNSMVKHSSQSDAVINGVPIPSDVARSVTRETRIESIDERRDGDYRVQKVDTTVLNGFRVFVVNIENGQTFAADVQKIMSSEKDREIIRDAEWSKVPVRLQINAKVMRGVVQEATILKADRKELEDER